MDHLPRCLEFWMVASTIHLSMPVCRGDALKSGTTEDYGRILHACFDIEKSSYSGLGVLHC